jgi:large subunit ribosomal protein L25
MRCSSWRSPGGENTLAIAREVQKHPVSRELEHIDFVIVRRGEKVEVDVPLTLVGEAAPSTLVQHEELTLAVLADATALPESISVDITGRGVGEHVFAKDIALPAGVELVADPELLVVNVSAEISEAQLEAELGETPADDEAAEEETPAAE